MVNTNLETEWDRGALYLLTCQKCGREGRKAYYVRETARTPYDRGAEHLSAMRKGDKESRVVEHEEEYHGGPLSGGEPTATQYKTCAESSNCKGNADKIQSGWTEMDQWRKCKPKFEPTVHQTRNYSTQANAKVIGEQGNQRNGKISQGTRKNRAYIRGSNQRTSIFNNRISKLRSNQEQKDTEEDTLAGG